jgi:hypothetical protein
MTFEEYEHEHLFALTECAKKLVRMGWNARGEHGSSPEKPDNSGSSQGILDSSACEVSITQEMIEAGAQRLVAWEDGSEWPDSWDSMTVAAARNEAERVLRSALNARADHIPDVTKMVQGDYMRAAFELDYSNNMAWPQAVERNQDGQYKYVGASAAWEAWQRAWAASKRHVSDAEKMVRGGVALMGDVTDEDGTTYHKALVVQFATVEDFHAAMKAGQCRFTVFGGEV